MSDGRPPLFDDGGGLPDTERHAHRPLDPPSGPPADDNWDGEWEDRPNYLVRRAIAVGVVVAVLAAAAIVIGQLIGGDDGGDSATGFDTSWNTVVVLDADTITLVDPGNGDELGVFDAPADLLDAQSLVIGNVLIVLTDDGRISQVDLSDGSIERARAGQDETLELHRDNPRFALIAPDDGGDVTVVDPSDRSTVSVADAAGIDAPLMFRSDLRINPAGTHAAITDRGGRVQTLIVDLAEETVEIVGGQIVAINDEVVVTAQFAGDETELEYWDLLGTRLESVDVPTPEATLLTSDNRVVAVDATGVVSVARENGDVEEVGRLTVAVDDETDTTDDTAADDDAAPLEETVTVTGGAAAFANRRLVVTSTDHTFVLDDRGTQLAVTAGAPGGVITNATTCVLAIAEGLEPSRQLDLDEGESLVAVPDGFVAAESLDGCTAAIQGGTRPVLVRTGAVARVDLSTVTAISPDGSDLVSGTRAATSIYPADDLLAAATGDDEPDGVRIARGDVVVRFATR